MAALRQLKRQVQGLSAKFTKVRNLIILYHDAAIDLETNEEVAIKFEPIKTKFPQLYYEAKLYKIFDAPGIPKMYSMIQTQTYFVLFRSGGRLEYSHYGFVGPES